MSSDGKSLCIVTGASRGLGRACAVEIEKAFGGQFDFVLVARDAEKLEESKKILKNSPEVGKVTLVAADLADATAIEQCIGDVFASLKNNSYSRAILVNNAGSLGDLSKLAHEYEDVAELTSFMTLNFTSMIALTSRFLREFKSAEQCFVVNVSSLMAVQAFPYWSLYCLSKSGRDMFNLVMAKEQAGTNVKTLSWAPGPLDTDMSEVVRSTVGDEGQKTMFKDLHENHKTVNPYESAAKLAKLLKENTFESGAHLDFYDV